MKYQKTTISQAATLLQNNNAIALFAHTNPDGDTIGASVALCLALRKAGKTVEVFCDTELNDKLKRFDKTAVVHENFFGKYDLFVSVDCGDIFRVGQYSGPYAAFKNTLTLDHHCGEYFSEYNCVLDYASTCQIIYEILRAGEMPIDSEIATYLYMGLCTDTGNFANRNTDSASFLMAAELVELGADIQKVYTVFFRDTTIAETKLIGRVLSRIRSYYDNQMLLLYVTKDDLRQFDLDMSATSGLVRFAIEVDTAKIGVCISEYADDVYKVSMRGKDFSVRKVCEEFGGGGHELASGCMINGMLEEVIEKIVRVVGYWL